MTKPRDLPADPHSDKRLAILEEQIVFAYGHSLSVAQRHELQASLRAQQGSLDRLRAYRLKHSDEPAMTYKVPIS